MSGVVKASAADRHGAQTASAEAQPAGNTSVELEMRHVNARTFSLTKRIIVSVVTCQLLLALGLALVAIAYARTQLGGAFDTALEGDALATLALVRYTETRPHVLMFDSTLSPPFLDPNHRALFEIRGADGRLIVRSPGWSGVPTAVAQADKRYVEFNYGGTPYRAVIIRGISVLDSERDVGPEKVTVYYSSSLEENRERLEKLAAYVGGTSLLFLLAANSFAIWSIRRGLHPLDELAAQADAISVHNWDFRPASGARLAKELSPLTQAIETVLARLKKSFRQQRDFTNDAAHELKTSVAILKSALQSLLQRPRTQRDYEIGLDGLLEDCSRLEDLLERMLRLARIEQLSENGARPKLATTELTSTCEAAVSRIQALAQERNVVLEFEGCESVHLLADPEDLELIWLNLLENAVQYSPEGSAVKIRVEPNGGSVAQVSVIDSGPGIPPTELPHIFERFHRGDPSRARSTGGFGLGLAICKALVDAYGGTIEAMNLPVRGTELRVRLPIRLN